MNVEKSLKTAAAVYKDALRVIGAEVREKVIIPFCDKHQVQFCRYEKTRSGAGGYYFLTLDNNFAIDEFDDGYGLCKKANASEAQFAFNGYLDPTKKLRGSVALRKALGAMTLFARYEYEDETDFGAYIGNWCEPYCPSNDEKEEER